MTGSMSEERFGGELAGSHVVEVHREACALPDGVDAECATVGTFGHHLGIRDFSFGETFAFDAEASSGSCPCPGQSASRS